MHFALWNGHNSMGTRKHNVVVWMRWCLGSLKHLNTFNTAEYFTLWEGPKTMKARKQNRMLWFEWDGAPGVPGIWILTLHWWHCLERFGRYGLIGGSIYLDVDFESLKIHTIPNLLSLPPSQSLKCNLPATMLDASCQASQPKKTSIFLEP